jgi:hypothetical protein
MRSTCPAVQAAGATELIGPGDPPGHHAQAEEAHDDDGIAAAVHPDVPGSYTVELATRYFYLHAPEL